jgi:hypothetical protein
LLFFDPRKIARKAVLMYLVLVPNAGPPRCSWTKGKKRSCDRCWARGGGGTASIIAEKKESTSEVQLILLPTLHYVMLQSVGTTGAE